MTECSGEALYYEVSPHNGHGVVEVTTHHDRCILVLAYDITNDISNTQGSLFEVHCFTTFKVAVEQVYVPFVVVSLDHTKYVPSAFTSDVCKFVVVAV